MTTSVVYENAENQRKAEIRRHKVSIILKVLIASFQV